VVGNRRGEKTAVLEGGDDAMSKERSSCAKTGCYKSGISDLNTG